MPAKTEKHATKVQGNMHMQRDATYMTQMANNRWETRTQKLKSPKNDILKYSGNLKPAHKYMNTSLLGWSKLFRANIVYGALRPTETKSSTLDKKSQLTKTL